MLHRDDEFDMEGEVEGKSGFAGDLSSTAQRQRALEQQKARLLKKQQQRRGQSGAVQANRAFTGASRAISANRARTFSAPKVIDPLEGEDDLDNKPAIKRTGYADSFRGSSRNSSGTYGGVYESLHSRAPDSNAAANEQVFSNTRVANVETASRFRLPNEVAEEEAKDETLPRRVQRPNESKVEEDLKQRGIPASYDPTPDATETARKSKTRSSSKSKSSSSASRSSRSSSSRTTSRSSSSRSKRAARTPSDAEDEVAEVDEEDVGDELERAAKPKRASASKKREERSRSSRRGKESETKRRDMPRNNEGEASHDDDAEEGGNPEEEDEDARHDDDDAHRSRQSSSTRDRKGRHRDAESDGEEAVQAEGKRQVDDDKSSDGEYDAIERPIASTIATPHQFDLRDMRAFLMQPIPKSAGVVQCYIERNKSGASKLFPEYHLFMKEGDRFLMAAKKRAKNRTSNYSISMDSKDLNKGSGNFVGKLRANFIGTEFQIFDHGVNPKNSDPDSLHVGTTPVREELGCVLYASNVLGSRGPRKMKVAVPAVGKDGKRAAFRPTRKGDEILSRFKERDMSDLIELVNKPPRWNDHVGAYVLNFNGRVTMASVKNFQLVSPEDEDAVILQFGRVGKDLFTTDLSWPLSPLQAFAICLSSFDSKLACE